MVLFFIMWPLPLSTEWSGVDVLPLRSMSCTPTFSGISRSAEGSLCCQREWCTLDHGYSCALLPCIQTAKTISGCVLPTEHMLLYYGTLGSYKSLLSQLIFHPSWCHRYWVSSSPFVASVEPLPVPVAAATLTIQTIPMTQMPLGHWTFAFEP